MSRPACRTARGRRDVPGLGRGPTSPRLSVASMPCCAQALDDGRPAGDRLEAAEVAAGAEDVAAVGCGDVAEVAGRALGAPVQLAAADDARADAGGHLDEDEVLDVGVDGRVLAERHDVDVVVHQDGPPRAAADVGRDVVAVPARHDRRQRPAARWSARPGRAGRCPRRRGPGAAPARRLQQRPAGAHQRVEDVLADRGRCRAACGPLGDDASAEVGERHERMCRPESAPMTTRAWGLNANLAGGRPPVDAASPEGASRPAASRASTLAPTVDLASPVSWISSARVRGVPSRMSCSRSPAPDGPATPASAPCSAHEE